MNSEVPPALADLGPGPELVYRILRECEPATSREIANQTCRSQHVVWSCLERLRDEDLVARRPVVTEAEGDTYQYRVI